jgi:hypothetical protein
VHCQALALLCPLQLHGCGCQGIDKLGEGSQNLVSLVRGGAPNGFPEVVWVQARWTRGRAVVKGPESLADSWLRSSKRRRHWTRGQGGLGVLSQHLLQGGSRRRGQTIRCQSLDGFAILAILNCQLHSSDVDVECWEAD